MTSTAVVFGEGRRPEATTRVQVAEFEGPLALLLALIEARQLDVLTVPLGALAEAYLDALATLEADRLGNISSFVAVASQLILIKSRAMLPRRPELTPGTLPEDEPDPEAELRARLLLYRAHRDAGLRLQAEAQARVGLFRREPAAAIAAGLAAPAPPTPLRSTPTSWSARSPGWFASPRHHRCQRRRWREPSRSPSGPRSSARQFVEPAPGRSCSRSSCAAFATAS